MSKAKQTEKEQTQELESHAGADGEKSLEAVSKSAADIQVARRVASLAKLEDREAAERLIMDWRDQGLFVSPDSDQGKRLTAKAREEADVIVALCLVRLGQVGMPDEGLGAPARLCCDLVTSDKAKGGDLWLTIASEEMPQAITDRLRLIDQLARAKAQAVTILDVAGVIRSVRA